MRHPTVAALLLGLLIACDGEREPSPKVQSERPGEPESKPDPGSEPESESPPEPELTTANRFVAADLECFANDAADPSWQLCRGDGCITTEERDETDWGSRRSIRPHMARWLRGCLTDSAEACLLAGRGFMMARVDRRPGPPFCVGIDNDDLDAKRRSYQARACELDEQHCAPWAGQQLSDATTPAPNVERAIRLLEASCRRDDPSGCLLLAEHADTHASLGPALPRWQRACSLLDPAAAPHRACMEAARLELRKPDTGKHERAVQTLREACDPLTGSWRHQCKGPSTRGDEVCDPVFVERFGTACTDYAHELPDDEQLRLLAALCVPVLLDPPKETCATADRLATKLGRSLVYRGNLRERACAVQREACDETSVDDEGDDRCDAAEERCMHARAFPG